MVVLCLVLSHSHGEAHSKEVEAYLSFCEKMNSKAIVVLRDGEVVLESYWGGWGRDTAGPIHSVGKSMVSVLVGMAIEKGFIDDVEVSASRYLEEWQGTPKEKISIRHLLSMTSGLYMDRPNRMILRGMFSRDERSMATRLELEHDPGSRWAYHHPAYKLLHSILEEATGKSFPNLARDWLFVPLGMEQAKVSTGRFKKKHYKSIQCSALDLSKFGQLLLQEGKWNEESLVTPSYLKRAMKPSQHLNPSYGFLFWLNAGEGHRLPNMRSEDVTLLGPLLPDVPKDTIGALGAKDQKCYVIPSQKVVIVRLGGNAKGRRMELAKSGFDRELILRTLKWLKSR